MSRARTHQRYFLDTHAPAHWRNNSALIHTHMIKERYRKMELRNKKSLAQELLLDEVEELQGVVKNAETLKCKH